MRGAAVSLPVKYKFKPMYPIAPSRGNPCLLFLSTLATSTPKKEGSNDSRDGGSMTNEKTDPIVAFGKPPPSVPPVLGPLVALSLLQTWSGRDCDNE
ncbi:hypothetical protein CFOL_v3_19594 [Cephalotus follicularis]|uniref:Uncharacterized protein n=1 Tax=Cephalotus follicularis TaxID=3775 RepID=A0A1Q3C7C6_CEPFO|nr:hypothetical protein CFOL_v3_19594 [Cephalotus follicularis]